MGNPSVTTANKVNQPQKVQGIDPKNVIIDVEAKPVINDPGQSKDSTQVVSRKAGEKLASVDDNLKSGKWQMIESSDQLEQQNLAGEELAIAPVIDANGQIVNLENPTGMPDAVIESIEKAEDALLTPNDGNIKLDEEATGFWGGLAKNISNAGKGLFSMIGGFAGDAIPAAKQLVEKTPTKKSNKLATHLGLAGAGLVGLSSLDHLVKAGKSFFGRKDNQVPGLYYLMESLAQGGFTANVFKSAMEGKLNIKNTLYQVAGLLGLKVGENIIDGTAPKILDPFGGNIVKEAAEGIKYFGSPSQDSGGGGQAAPAAA